MRLPTDHFLLRHYCATETYRKGADIDVRAQCTLIADF